MNYMNNSVRGKLGFTLCSSEAQRASARHEDYSGPKIQPILEKKYFSTSFHEFEDFKLLFLNNLKI